MNKIANNKDFDELTKLVFEATSYHDKDKDEDDEDTCDEELEEVEDNEEKIEEGIFDRTKARLGAAKDTVGTVASDVKKAVSGKGQEATGVGNKYLDNKTQRLFQGHLKRVNKTISDLATDIVKMGIMDEDEAEDAARQISNRVKDMMQSNLTGGKKLDKFAGRNF